MKRINLTQGKVAIVDDEDYRHLNQFYWHAKKCGNSWYASRGIPRPPIDGEHQRPTTIFMHQEILGVRWIDHKDGNGLNNRRKNLRKTTRSQNLANSRKRAGTSSRFKGVYWDSDSNRWRAVISANNKKMYLGRFVKEIDAARAYNTAAREHFGAFSRLNKIPGSNF